MKGWNVKGRRKRTPFCLLLFCSFSSVNWSIGSFDERGWVQRLGGRRLLVLNGMRGERQLGRRRRQQPIHEYCQCCSPASCIHFPYKEPQWCPLAFWLAETAPGDAQSHVGGTDDGVCVCVCVRGSVGSWLKHHTANLHVPSPRPASGHTKGMMSCLANNKRVWVRQALLSNPASSSFIQPSINRKPYPLYWGWGMDNNKAGMGQH